MSLEFRHIAHSYGHYRALEQISLHAPKGEITCLLGKSGCGKSTLLNLAAGLLKVQSGQILLDGEILANHAISPPPEKRPIGMVFQDGALFPHMTIAQNIAFGLARDDDAAFQIEQWLDRVGLSGLAGRYPHELSGGQRQRAALARALAPKPSVVLLDEPFASVDIVLRRKLRRDCRKLLRDQGATVILVTHDPEEALDVADQIAVMEAGEIVQIGAPAQLFDAPATASVGEIFADSLVFTAQRNGDQMISEFGSWPLSNLALADHDAGDYRIVIRNGEVELAEDPQGNELIDDRRIGPNRLAVLRGANGAELTVEIAHEAALMLGKRYKLQASPSQFLAFPADNAG